MQPNTKHTITFTGSFSYKTLPDGRKQVILDVGDDDVQMTTTPSQRQGDICFLPKDVVTCIVAACDALSLVALKRTSHRLYEHVKALPLSIWEQLIVKLEAYPFILLVEKYLSVVTMKFLGKSRSNLATYLAYQLECPYMSYYDYIRLNILLDCPKQEVAEIWKDVHKTLLKEFYPHRIKKIVLKGGNRVSFIDRDGTKDDKPFFDKVTSSAVFRKLGEKYKFYCVY